MSAQILKGSAIAETIYSDISRRIEESSSRVKPKLLSLSIGGKDPASQVYVKNQMKAADKAGIDFETELLPAEITQDALLEKIKDYNEDSGLHGLLIQRPVPGHLDMSEVIETLDPKKDVEGMHPLNLGALTQGTPNLTPCTAEAAVRIARSVSAEVKGLEVVVVGHSEIVGKPIGLLLVQELATITICHIGTKDLKSHTTRADWLFVAAGVPGLITAEHVKPGAVVVDIGINRVPAGEGEGKKTRLVGDVDFEAVKEKAGYLTPVPGGVGPVTTAVLMNNTLKAALMQG